MLRVHLISAVAIVLMPSGVSSEDHVLPLKGEYKNIRTSSENKAITTFLEGSDEQKEKLASRIQNQPNRYAPVVFYHLAVYLYEEENSEEALFWLYCARIRTYYDIQRCTDRSVADAGTILNNLIPHLLRLEQFLDLEASKKIMKKAVKWDRETPHDYDARWIALHGIRASLPEPAVDTATPLTIPENQWEALAEENRQEYLSQWLEDLSSLTDEQLEQIEAKYDELLALEENGESEEDTGEDHEEDQE